ncbi:hypothetical protein NPIL_332711 [Nephila pilipes]|uniref:Uncharacterized protein n=1 Tax=Nephila pilipes TaxID=299642 RepID=A0A8X6Q1V8_NEPPI|nr:hypothetical protein NPIL_332711 [Nephila pilipes]
MTYLFCVHHEHWSYLQRNHDAPIDGRNFFVNICWQLTFCIEKMLPFFTFGGLQNQNTRSKDILLKPDLPQDWQKTQRRKKRIKVKANVNAQTKTFPFLFPE